MMTTPVNPKRVYMLRDGEPERGPVVYWMSRDQRVKDNWALLYAQEIALQKKAPLIVVFCLVPSFLDATIRQYSFMLKGLEEVEAGLRKYHITFQLLHGVPQDVLPSFISDNKITCLVTDFSSLRIQRTWIDAVQKTVAIPFIEVDTHNIVPCRIASSKCEFAAYTLRPKIDRLLPEFLEEIPQVKRHPYKLEPQSILVNWKSARRSLKADESVAEIEWLKPGEEAAHRMLDEFIRFRLERYNDERNNPTKQAQSNLSPYLHFGQIASQRVALEIRKLTCSTVVKDEFLEELIVRRELSDNFCFYNAHYDEFEGFPSWAKTTLQEHRKDRRQYVYSSEEFEFGRTHDALWNAAQTEMVRTGKMHGYLRMYWAKKILEWTISPEEALRVAIYLNDKYELDGRDPNGYAGIAWSIGGVHDRAWFDRPIFGKIRYMNAEGCRRKFNVNAYINAQESIK